MPRPVSPMHDEADVLEDAQVLRHGRPADGKPCRELAHRAGSRTEQLEDLPPRRVSERVQWVSVSLHLP
jgi:hypothetical protein